MYQHIFAPPPQKKITLNGVSLEHYLALDASIMRTDDPGPGHPKEVTITLLKAEPTNSRETWWRAPLKGLENRGQPVRRPTQPADPEMVSKGDLECIGGKGSRDSCCVFGRKPDKKVFPGHSRGREVYSPPKLTKRHPQYKATFANTRSCVVDAFLDRETVGGAPQEL